MDLLDYIERIGNDPPPAPRVAVSYHQNIQLASEFLEWPNSEAESANFSAPEEMSLPEVPSTSGGRGIFSGISDTLLVYFPDTYETISQNLLEMLSSSRSDNDLQCEIIDLLGVELFELAGEILEKRNKIVYEVKMKALAIAEEAKMNKAKPSVPGFLQTVSVQSSSQNEKRREMRKEEKRTRRELNRVIHAFGDEEKLELELAQKEIQRQRQLEIDQMKWKPSLLPGGPRVEEIYPYVFDARIQAGHTMFDINGMKFALPEGSKRDTFKTHESVSVPPSNKGDIEKIQHVYIKDMDELGQKGFKGFEKLNVIQSIVFEQAYKTKENLLICAPTGAGKTNIAMLTILNTIHEHQNSKGEIMKDDFKIIYIAPMKALATEMTESFGKRLAPLGLKEDQNQIQQEGRNQSRPEDQNRSHQQDLNHWECSVPHSWIISSIKDFHADDSNRSRLELGHQHRKNRIRKSPSKENRRIQTQEIIRSREMEKIDTIIIFKHQFFNLHVHKLLLLL